MNQAIPSIATVSKTGVITAKKEGSAFIFVTNSDGDTSVFNLTVTSSKTETTTTTTTTSTTTTAKPTKAMPSPMLRDINAKERSL